MSECAVLLLFCLSLSATASLAQGSAGTAGKLEPRFLVDMPTAGMLMRGSFATDIEFYREGGVLLGFSVGVLDRLSLGLSYGGSQLIGGGSPVMNPAPGVDVKARLLEESPFVPALALGFDTQGRDGYIRDLSRYTVKSPGLYAVFSKNYAALGFLSLHGGANYSLERTGGKQTVNLYGGLEKTIGSFVSVILEYNLASNDSGRGAVGRGKGYLNFAAKCTLGSGLTLGVNLKDLTKNGGDPVLGNRTVRLEYARPF